MNLSNVEKFHLQIEKVSADIGAGTALALVNDWGILIVNLAIVFGRVLVEIMIHRRKERKKNEG